MPNVPPMAIPLPSAPVASMKYSAAVTVDEVLLIDALKATLTLPLVGFGVNATPLVVGPVAPAPVPAVTKVSIPPKPARRYC